MFTVDMNVCLLKSFSDLNHQMERKLEISVLTGDEDKIIREPMVSLDAWLFWLRPKNV